MNVSHEMLDTKRVIKIPDPFLKILCDLINVYAHKRVKKNPIYLNIMSQYCNCVRYQRQI